MPSIPPLAALNLRDAVFAGFAPSISFATSQAVVANGSTSVVVPFTVADTNTPLQQLEVTVSASSDEQLLPIANLRLRGDTQDPSAYQLEAVPVEGRIGSSEVTLRVSDGQNATTASVRIVVDGVSRCFPGLRLPPPNCRASLPACSPRVVGHVNPACVPWRRASRPALPG